jgi:hypothetical protein
MTLRDERNAAGARYAAALAELAARYIELAAIDRIAASRLADVRGFHGIPTHIEPWLRHPEFAPDGPALADPIRERAEVLARRHPKTLRGR